MHSKLSSFAKRILLHSPHFLGVSILLLGGTLLVQSFNIPTTGKATHTTTLSRVVLGTETSQSQQEMFFDPNNNKGRVVVSGGLVVGEIGGISGNRIDTAAINAVIVGGKRNTIGTGGRNATIGAGQLNSVNGGTAAIGAGYGNKIGGNADYAIIAAGADNKVYGRLSSIGGGHDNSIHSAYSIIPGGSHNTISSGANYSFAAGEMTDVQASSTFAWSDYDNSSLNQGGYGIDNYLTATKANTFLIRAKNGLAINTASVPTGVNVNVGGAVYIGSQGLIYSGCRAELAGTFEQEKGCFFYCDGKYRHTIGLNLEGDSVGRYCKEIVGDQAKIVTKVCLTSDGVRYRAGEYLTGYTSATAPCSSKALECGNDGAFRGKGTKTPVADVYAQCS